MEESGQESLFMYCVANPLPVAHLTSWCCPYCTYQEKLPVDFVEIVCGLDLD